jgi:RNA polymerase sigma factor (sigma-70 family)
MSIPAMPGAQFGKVVKHIHRMATGNAGAGQSDRQILDRFSANRDESAFSVLVSRHGPMVLRVCRRVLQHEQDAEDAFQAVFLVLARNSASIRKREALAEWLHGVSYRTAMKAKRTAARRRTHEARLQAGAATCIAKPTWDDVQSVLDEELQRLPKAFRAAFVHCVLEGKSGPQAARELGIPEGTVSSRVTRARLLLRERLCRRGIQLGALLAALSVAESAEGAPTAILVSAIRLIAAGGSVSATISPRVAELAAAMTRALCLSKVKILSAVLLATGLGIGAAHQVLSAREAGVTAQKNAVAGPPLQPQPKETTDRDDDPPAQESIAYSGRVLDAQQKPVSGAKLYMTTAWGYPHRPSPSPELATTGPDGRFSFLASKEKFGDQPTVVAAAATNFSTAWINIPADGKKDDLTLRLATDDAIVTGQIVDLQGQPLAGATLSLMQINAAPDGNLGPWLEACKGKKGLSFQLEQRFLRDYTIAVPLEVTTDAAGNFRLPGVGKNRLIRVQLDGESIASEHLCIITKPGEPIQVIQHEGNPDFREPDTITTYYGSPFRHVAAPCKPIVGMVRDKDTKKPLAGITVRSETLKIGPSMFQGFDLVQTTTDRQGRFRLTGMPKRDGNRIVAIPNQGLPYPAVHAEVPSSPGLDPVSVDIELKRGIWIEGQITDKETGKPLKAIVEYFALYSNPSLRDYPGYDGTFELRSTVTKQDGKYRILGLPGPGFVVVHSHLGNDWYLKALERKDEYGIKEPPPSTAPYQLFPLSNYGAFARIDVAAGAVTSKRNATLDSGWTFKGTVLGLDGKPMAGVQAFGVREPDPLKTADFIARYNPERPHKIRFVDSEKGLVGIAEPPKQNGAHVVAQMMTGATLTGRLVDQAGKPRWGIALELSYRSKGSEEWSRYFREDIVSDSAGRFKLTPLIPDYEYRISDGKAYTTLGQTPRSGESRDLGDVQLTVKE